MSNQTEIQFRVVSPFEFLRLLREPAPPPIARNTDPGTSHAAAREHTESGKRSDHANQILAVVRNHPGLTYREAASHLPVLEPVEVQRRLADLASIGLVERGEHRACNVSGRMAQTWRAA